MTRTLLSSSRLGQVGQILVPHCQPAMPARRGDPGLSSSQAPEPLPGDKKVRRSCGSKCSTIAQGGDAFDRGL
jgi:hypothetical protein